MEKRKGRGKEEEEEEKGEEEEEEEKGRRRGKERKRKGKENGVVIFSLYCSKNSKPTHFNPSLKLFISICFFDKKV